MIDDFGRHDALSLAGLIARRETSVAEVTDAAIAVIERENPRLNAVIDERFAAARADAARMDGMTPEGPLWGVPFLLKDVNLYSELLPTRFGSRFFTDAAPRGDSILVARWRAAGLVILGTTNVPEFASDFTTEPVAYGPCRNPWDTNAIVGGSSGGAGAAVASGMVPMAHATDLGGSIRIPSACCGTFGFKPSVGVNPLGPWAEELAGGLDSDHVITRSVRDSAAALDMTAGAGIGTRLCRAPVAGGFLNALAGPLPALRIGLATLGPYGRQAQASQVAATERVARFLEARGHHVSPYAFPPEATPGEWFDLLWTMDIVHLVEERTAAIGRPPREDEMEPIIWQFYRRTKGSSAPDYFNAQRAMVAASVAIGRSMQGFDVILTPTVAEDVPPIGTISLQAHGDDVQGWAEGGARFAPFPTPANVAGLPAASCPVGLDARGLPVGVQIAGHAGADALILRLAREIEAGLGWASPASPAG